MCRASIISPNNAFINYTLGGYHFAAQSELDRVNFTKGYKFYENAINLTNFKNLDFLHTYCDFLINGTTLTQLRSLKILNYYKILESLICNCKNNCYNNYDFVWVREGFQITVIN